MSLLYRTTPRFDCALREMCINNKTQSTLDSVFVNRYPVTANLTSRIISSVDAPGP